LPSTHEESILNIKHIGVIGAGTMGSGIAQVCAVAKYKVTLIDLDPNQLDRAKKIIDDSLNRFARKDKLPESVSDIKARIDGSRQLAVCENCDMVIEAVYEDIDIKTDIIQKISRAVSPAAIIGTNTSAISITTLAAGAVNPERVIGIHFFNPVPMLKAVEVIRGMQTNDHTMEMTTRFIDSLDKRPIAVNRDIPGFLLNRINLPSNLEAMRMVEQGIATIEDVDEGVKLAFGRPMGIFELGDLVGLDVTLNACDAIYAETKDSKYLPPVILRRMVKAGRLGKKVGQGWYEYSADGSKRSGPTST
jgi:3-hydroxybutyryl-CoA dehydrogenase